MHSWYTVEKTVAIINVCHDHALYKQFGGGRCQELPYLSDIMQVIVDWLTCLVNLFCHLKVNVKSGGGELPHISHIGMCRPIGWGFCAVLVWKRVYTLSILVWNRVWFSRKPRSVWMYLSFQFQMSEKEGEICEFEMNNLFVCAL